MDKLIVNEPSFNLEVIQKGHFIEVNTKIGGEERKFQGVIDQVDRDKIHFSVGGGDSYSVLLQDVIDGKDKIKIAKNLNFLSLYQMVKQMDIIHDHYEGNSIEIITNDSAEAYSKVTVNGRDYTIMPLIPKEVTCNLGTLNLK